MFAATILLVCSLLSVTAFAQPSHLDSVRNELAARYSNLADSQKLLAANFLLDNMDGHGFVDFVLQDTNKHDVPFDVMTFASYESLEDGFRELEKSHGVLDFQKSNFVHDDSVITADFLADHIDFAFRARQERPWARALSWNQFCEYVLPYRGSNEPLELWRGPLFDQYDSLKYQIRDSLNPIEAAAAINRDLMSWFHFDPRFYYHPTDQGLSDMRETKIGRCEDMTNLSIFAMRANGLAVTSDYTPYWANSGNNHAWNAIVIPSGEVIPFMGAEANPGEYRLANKLAKVYRKTYAVQKNNLAFLVNDREALPGYLAGKSYVDVTKDYVPVTTVALELSGAESDSFAYLCVFNSGEWRPIQWSRIQNGGAVFVDMGRDIVYLPCYYRNKKTVPAGSVFLLDSTGLVQPFSPDTTSMSELNLISTTRVKQEASTDGVLKSELNSGTVYEGFYWNGKWVSLGEKTSDGGELIFRAPAGSLYWLVAKDSDNEERIFSYLNGKQVWW